MKFYHTVFNPSKPRIQPAGDHVPRYKYSASFTNSKALKPYQNIYTNLLPAFHPDFQSERRRHDRPLPLLPAFHKDYVPSRNYVTPLPVEKQKHYINADNVDKVGEEPHNLTAKNDGNSVIDNGDSHNPQLSMTQMLYSMNKTSDNEVDVDDEGNMEDLEMADVVIEGNEENMEESNTEDGEIKILKTDIQQNQAESTEESGEDFTVSPIIIEEEEINGDGDKEIATDAVQELVV